MIRRLLSLVWLVPALLLAQGPYGRITGRVVDSSGSAVPGATVQVVNAGTNVATAASSDAEGNYEARNLIPGPYRIVVEMRGFKRYQRGSVELRVGDVLALDVTMELGVISESVTVTSEVPLLESAGASLGQVVDNRQLLELPLPSSSPMYLTQLAPGIVTTTPPTHNWQPNQPEKVSSFGTNGTQRYSSEFTLDGIANMTGAIVNFQPPPEILQEFRVQTAVYDASAGHFTGALVSMVTKSGTNQLHGNLTYTHNNRPLNTHPFFVNKQIYDTRTGPPTQEKINNAFPPTRMNRYRASGSGPVYIPGVYDGRNRTFWTYGFDRFVRVFVPRVSSLTVPTVAERNGDFSALLALGSQYQIYDPATIAAAANGRFSRQPFPNNIVPAARINPVAKKLLDYYPMPNSTGTADGLNNYIGSPVNQPVHQNNIIRLDHALTPSHRFFVSVFPSMETTPQQATSNFAVDYLGQINISKGVNVAFDDVIALRPDLVLNFRYGVSRGKTEEQARSAGFDMAAAGFAPALASRLDKSLATLPQINIDGFAQFGRDSGSIVATTYHTVAGNVAHSRHNHSLRFGGEWRVFQENAAIFGNISPNFIFSTDWTRGPLDTAAASPIGQGMAAYLLGLPTGGGIDRNSSYSQQSQYLGLFLQDDWKLSRRLTVNLGLRYELELPSTERYDRMNRGFDFATPNPVQEAARAKYAAAPIPEVPANEFRTTGGLLFASTGGVPRGMWESDRRNLAPRIGLAWQVLPNMVVRAGYGIYFDSLGADRLKVFQQGYSQRTVLTPSLDNGQTFRATLSNPFPDGILEPAASSAGLKTFLGRAVGFVPPERKPGYTQRWSLNIQRELPGRTLVEAGYVGNRGTGLSLDEELDPVPERYLSRSLVRDQSSIDLLNQNIANPFFGMPEFAGSSLQGRTITRSQLLRPFPQFTGMKATVSSGFSWYHSLQVRTEKRFARGYTLQASYTWSKFMEAIQKLNATDLAPHHVVSDWDRPHHLVVSGMYELPFGKGRHGVFNRLAGGWSVQAIYQAQSGPPIGFGNIIYTGGLQDMVLPRSERTVERWFNTGAGFEKDSRKQLASNARTFPLRLTGLRADGYNNWDFSLIKDVAITERIKFQLRAECQDIMNHAMFNPPNSVPNNANFGQVTATVFADQRRVTVGGRLVW